jgi:YD repeat-containing protein
MVAVIAGNGLGLGNTSLRQLGQGLGGQAAIGQSGVDQYLNAATGNLVLQNADEGLIFDGLPLEVLRTYNSQGQLAGNQGWLFGFTRSIGGLTGSLDTAGSTITRTSDDGSAVVYAYNTTLGQYVSGGQSGAVDILSWSAASSTWTWVDAASSQQEAYNAAGQLITLSDSRTGAHYDFSYSGSQLTRITAGDGDTLLFGYNTLSQLISLSVQQIPPGQTTAVTRQQVGYTYDAQGRLSTVTTTLASDTNPSGTSYATTYAYDGSSDRVASITQSDGTTVGYTYTENAQGVYQVTGITTGMGAAAQTVTLSYASGSTTLTNGLGQATTYTYNAAGELIQVTAPTVNGVTPATTYQYDANGNLLQMTDANGGITSYGYDANGNLLSIEDATGHTISYTYNVADQVLSQTTYTVAAQGVAGRSGYIAPSGAQTTYHVYDASDRLSYVVDPLGNVTQYTYASATGGIEVLSSTEQYAGATYDLTGLSPATPPTLAQLQGWVASAQVQAALARSMRTDYTYDFRGQLATQTRWDTLNSSGMGTLTGDVGATVTSYTYDAQGRLLQTATERGGNRAMLETTSYAYDGLGRLIGHTDPLGQVTNYVYTDSGNTLAITQANGLSTTQVRNSAGLLLSSTQSISGQASRVTSYLYNAVGQNVATIDPAGNISYTFYDADGRVTGTVDATGAVTAFSHDADGHVVGTTQYATPVSTTGWVSGGALTTNLPPDLPVPTATADDRTSHVIVDAAGREIAAIDAAGAVTITTYDGEGNAIGHTAYATALTPAQLAALGSMPTWAALQADLTPSANDRITHAFYDADQRVVATQDAAGYVVTTAYDAAGRVTRTVAHAVAVAGTSSLGTLLAGLAADAGDQITRTYYDGEGRAVAQIDADGYLTTTTYDETTHVTTTARYGMAFTSAQLAALTGSESVAALVGLLGGNTANQQSSTTYNADGQVTTATAVDGTVTTNSYNLVGQLLSTTVTPTVGQGAARTINATYDAFGDTLTHVDGNHATTTYTYNALGQRITATDALGNITYTYYDADGRVAYTVQGQPSGAARNALGNVTAYSYNAFGQVASTRHYASQLTLTSGSSSGTTLNPVTATLTQVSAAVAALPVSASDADGLTTYSYTLDGQVASVTDGRGFRRASTYDVFGDLTQTQQQLSQPGLALSAANSTISTFTYDARGEQTSQAEGVGSAMTRNTSTAYDAFGRVISSTDGNGHVVTYGYDNLGRRVSSGQVVQGAIRAPHTAYDAFGRTVTQTDALGNVSVYQYNLTAHTTIVTTPDGVTMTTVKDAFGDTVSVTDGAGDTTTYSYDADGHRLTTRDALGQTVTNQYDADGELIQTTDASGRVVTTSYDASGRVLTRTVDPSGLALKTAYSYDGEGRELSVTDPAGVVTTYTYDADGQVLTQVQDAGAGKLNLTTTYTHDGVGKTLTVTVGVGTTAARTTQYVYDSLERLSQQIVDPSGLHLTTSYTYDANDNLIGVTDANGHVTRSVYDEANEKIFAIDATGAVTRTTVDADGRITVVRAYATALTAAQLTVLGSAPTVADVAAAIVTSASDAVSYTAYNAEGQVRYRIDPRGNVTETRYDAAGRVSETLAYAYAVSVTAGEAAILQASQATALSSLGTLVSGTGNTDANAQVSLRLYDADGQVRFVVQQNTVNGQLIGQVTEQRYDAAGRVVASIAYGSTLALSTTSSLSAQLTTSSVAQALASAPRQISQSVYDNAGRLRYTIDTTNHVTETQVDANGRVTAQLAYANAIAVPGTLTVATVAAAVTATGTAGARISSTTYDAVGRVLATGDALGANATFTYDATGLQTGRADRDGHWTYYLYDQAGRKTLEQSPSVNVGSWAVGTGAFQQGVAYLYTTYGYHGVGNVTSIGRGTGPDSSHVTTLSTTAYIYDAVGHQIQTTYPGGISTHVVYDALGNAVADQDANGHWQYKVYNGDHQVTYAVDAAGYVTGTSYDAYGNVTATTRYATALNTAAITGWSAGQALTMAQLQQGLATSASDRTITTAYDQRNRKVQVQQPTIAIVLTVGPLAGKGATGAPTTTYTYDAYGNTTSVSTLIQPALTVGATTTPAVWATTYTYYDTLNRAVMTVTPAGAYTNPQGYVTATTYDAFGEVASSTQFATAIATGGLTTAMPPAAPAADAYDRITTYGYDAIGRKTSQTDAGEYSYVNGTPALAAGSSVTTMAYDGENHVTSLTVNGLTTTTTYDALGRVSSVTGPARQVLVSNWQAILQSTPGDDLTSAALYTTVSPLTYVIYDALGNTLNTTVQAGSLSQQTWAWYDARGNQIQVQDANSNEHYSTYDNNGNVLTQSYTLTGNSGSSTVTSSYTYDADNQQLTTAVQRSGQSGYDSYTQVQYDAFGEVVAKGDNNGIEAHYTYNNAGQLSTAPDSKTGAIHTYGYDLAGHAGVDGVYVTGGSQQTWTVNTLDLGGRIVSRVLPSDAAATGESSAALHYTYDRWDNVTSTTDAAGNTTQYYYDSRNQLAWEIEPNVLVVSATGTRTWARPSKEWYYNVSGQLIGATDENSNTSWNTYDAGGNLTIAQDGTGAHTYTAYDALGRAVARQTPPVQTATGPVAHITYTSYNALNQVTSQGDFLLDSTGAARTQQAQQSYMLNSNGDRIQLTDALGNTSFYDYDSQHRILSSQTPTQHANGWAETFSYDANGHKTGDTTANGDHQSWVVDYFGRVQSHIDLSGATTTYTYDASSGLLTSATSNWAPAGQTNPGYLPTTLTGSGSSVQYQYYANGQVAQVTQTTGGVTAGWDTYQYDVNGNQAVDASYTTDGAGQVVHTETIAVYDSHNRLSVETTENPDSAVANSRVVYNYDAAGNRRAVFAQSAYGATATPISGNGGAPTAASIGTQTAPAGQPWNFNASANFTDNVGFGLTYTATLADGSALPSWMSFNNNGSFGGTPSANGSWSVTVIATDVNGQGVSTTFTVTVPVATPVFTGGTTDQTGSVHGALNFTVPGATDANGSSLTYSATLSSGAALPSWLSFNAGTRTFTGTPPVGSIGSYALKVTATAANGGTASETLNLTVAPTAPVYTGGVGNQTVYGGRAFSFSYPASDFSEPDGDALTFSAGSYVMNSGVETDSALPSWMSFNAGTLTFTGAPPTSVVNQNFNLYLMAKNPQGQAAEAYFTVTVAQYVQPAPVYNGTLVNQTGVIGGSSLNLALPAGAFTEPDGGALTYSAMVLIPTHDLDYPVNGGTDVATRTVAAQWVALSNVGLSINATTGAITGVPTTLTYQTSQVGSGTYAHDSTYQIEINAANAQAGTATGTFTLTNSFAPPALVTTLANHSVNPGSGTIVEVPAGTFSDPYAQGLTYSATLSSGAALPGGLSWSGTGFTVGAVSSGSYTINVTATDGLGHTGSATFTLTVANAAPVFSSPTANLSTLAGVAMAAYVAPVATDANGDAITYSASGMPAGIAFDASTRTFSGTPTTTGTSTVTYTATDSKGVATSATFTLAVTNAAPVFSAAPTSLSTLAGVAMAAYVAPVATDANGDALTYSASGMPTGVTFNASTRTFSGTPSTVGTYTVTYAVTDSRGAVTSTSFSLTVTNAAPVFSAAPTNLSTMASVAMAAYQAPAATDANGDVLTYSASGMPTGVTFNASTHTFSGTPTTMGTYTVTYTVNDSRGASTSTSFTITVAQYVQPVPVYNGTLVNQTGVIGGSSLNLALPAGAFTEPDGGALTYNAMVLIPTHDLDYPVNGGTDVATRTVAAQWVALSNVGLSINATTGAITGVPTTLTYQTSQVGSGTYAHDSTYQIEINAANAQAGTATGTFTLTNSFAPPALVTTLANHSVNPGSGTIVEVPAGTFSDPYAQGLTYSATLSSGAALPSGLSWSGTGFTVGAVSSGSYTIKVTATDGLGHTGSATFTLTVANAAPVIGALVNQAVTAGAAMAAYVAPGATDANGDAITYSASGMPAGIAFDASTRTFSGTPTTAGTYTVTYTATDSKGLATSATFVITVNPPVNAAPVYNGGIPAQVDLDVSMGSPASYTVPATAFSSPAGQTLTYSVLQSNGTVLPTWLAFNASTRTFTASVRKLDASLTLTLTAKDTQNRTASYTFNVYVWGTGSVSTLAATTGSTTPAHGQAHQTHGQAYGQDATAQDTTQATTLQATAQVQTEAVATAPNVQSYWFTYDADNRVVVNNGALSNGQIVVAASTYTTPSYANQYDAAGNVVVRSTLADGSDQFLTYGGVWYSHAAGTALTQRLVYDARSELVETDYAMAVGEVNRGAQSRETYDADGHLLSNNTYERNGQVWAVYGTTNFPNGYEYLDLSGWLWTGQVSAYGADGQVAQQAQFGRWGVDWKAVANKEDAGTLPDEINATPTVSSDGALVAGGVTTYTGFDHAGNVTDYSYYQPTVVQGTTAYGATYHVNYLKKDGYLEQSTTGTPTVSGYVPATDTSYYDAFGRRLAISQTSQANSGAAQNTTRVFADDAAGEIVQRRSGTVSGSTFTPYGGSNSHHYTYVNGQQVSDMDEGGGINVASTLTAFSSGGGSAGSYVVQGGDTLASIAQSVYGNSQYGYIVAEANGLSGDGDLVAGQSITIPSVTTRSNTANTFKPYNPGQIAGSTTPNLPAVPPPPPPSSSGCSGLAQVVMIAVIVVASIYTAGLAAEMMAGTAGTAGFGATMSAGLSVMTGGIAGTAAAAGATGFSAAEAAFVGGALGSAAGQLSGDAMGITHGFSFGQMLSSGLTAAAGSELGGALKGSNTAALFNEAKGTVTPLGAALQGAGSYAAGTAANAISGQATHFSWAGLAASAMASGVTAEAGLKGGALQKIGEATDSSFTQNLAGGLLSGALNRETSQLLGDNRVGSWASIGEDAFGNALGNAVVSNAISTLPPIPVGSDTPRIQIGPQTLEVSDIPQTLVPVVADVLLSGGGVSSFGGSAASATAGSLTYYSDLPLSGKSGPGVDYLVAPDGSMAGGGGEAPGDLMQRLNALVPAMNTYRTDPSVDHGAWQIADQEVEKATHGVWNNTSDAATQVAQAEEAVNALTQPVQALGGVTVVPSAADIAAAEDGTAFAASNWSLATAGTGVGSVDWVGNPDNPRLPVNVTLFGAYANVWRSDESYGTKALQSLKLLNYERPNLDQRFAIEDAQARAAEAPYARIDMLRGSTFAGIGWSVATLSGASDATADRVAQTVGVMAPLVAAGVGAYGLSVLKEGEVPNTTGVDPAVTSTEQDVVLFSNKFPNDPIGDPKVVPNDRLSGISGNFNYVVTEDGSLIVGRSGHTSLTGGADVQAAGEVQLYNGNIKWLDNSSGHYQPFGPTLQPTAENAFNNIGLNATGKFNYRTW